MSPQWIIAPIVLPLLVAALQLLLGERRRGLAVALSLLSCVALVVLAAAPVQMQSDCLKFFSDASALYR